MQLAAPPDDPGLVEACGEDPGTMCEVVWDATESEGWAKAADWFIGRPLTVLVIVAITWLVVRLARRAVRRGVTRLIAADSGARSWALERVGGPSAFVREPRREGRAASISAVLASVVTVTLWVMAMFLILGEFDIQLAPLIAGAGIAGVALGFGAQSLVKDCIAGLFMLIEDQYGIGDEVDLGEAQGTVERISLRTTVLRAPDGTVWHVPNGEIVRVGNRSEQWSVALLDVSVGHDTNLEAVTQLLRDTATQVCASEPFAGDVIEAPEVLGVENLAFEGVTLRLRVKTRAGSQHQLQRALREAVKSAFDNAGIAMAPRPAPPQPPQRPPP